MYRVKDWADYFENNRTGDMINMKWVPFPNKHDGDGFTELLDHPNGMAHFGAWVLIVQVASKCGKPAGRCGPGETPRGTLRRENGKPHDLASIARVSAGDIHVLAEAMPRLLDIGWLEEIPDDTGTYENPQEGAPLPQAPALIPQGGDDRARGRIPFLSLPFSSEGGPGETKATQADHARALRVSKLYPAKASKDSRPINFPLVAQNLLASRIAKHPDYPWEEHAALVARIPTPLDGLKWVEDMPNPIALDKLREAGPKPIERNRL